MANEVTLAATAQQNLEQLDIKENQQQKVKTRRNKKNNLNNLKQTETNWNVEQFFADGTWEKTVRT